MPDLEMPRPIDAMPAGKTTAIVATGGVERNGPYATGKHNYSLRATALVAPIIAFVPEGDMDPPTSPMKYPGTISLTEETFALPLTDIRASFKTHGFKNIVPIGDRGGDRKGMKEAARLNAKWKGSPKLRFIPGYYGCAGVKKWLELQGIHQTGDGLHGDFQIATGRMAVDPNTVRMKQRRAKGKLSIDGQSLEPPSSIEWGKKAVEYRATQAVKAIRKPMGEQQ